jgi:hypothetical protein
MYPADEIPLSYHHFIFCYLLPIFSAMDMEITLDIIASFYKNQFDASSKPGHALYRMILTLIDVIQT